MSLRLGVDLDGVTCNWTKKAIQMLNARFELDRDECGESPHWEWIEENTTKKQWAWLWTAGVDRGMFANLEVLPGAYDSLERLTRDHRVFLVTNRPQASRRDTIYWVAKNLPFNFQGITTTKCKWEVECDVYLDDKPENVRALRDNRWASHQVLFRRQYNEYFKWDPDVRTWIEFERYVRILERRLV